VGGPKWVSEDRFYIQATTAVPTGDHDLMLMLQTLLSDRFRLVLHHEQRALSGYRLVLGKGGLKAGVSAPDGGSVGNSSRGRIDGKGYTMAQLAMKLSQTLHEPVLDDTAVAGRFDLRLEWTPVQIALTEDDGRGFDPQSTIRDGSAGQWRSASNSCECGSKCSRNRVEGRRCRFRRDSAPQFSDGFSAESITSTSATICRRGLRRPIGVRSTCRKAPLFSRPSRSNSG